MPGATNPIDSIRTYFEDSGGSSPPVLVYPGFTDPLEYAKASPLAQALNVDHRSSSLTTEARAAATNRTMLPLTRCPHV
jgi:hypothetical protein